MGKSGDEVSEAEINPARDTAGDPTHQMEMAMAVATSASPAATKSDFSSVYRLKGFGGGWSRAAAAKFGDELALVMQSREDYNWFAFV
jgi:hypothetical protein